MEKTSAEAIRNAAEPDIENGFSPRFSSCSREPTHSPADVSPPESCAVRSKRLLFAEAFKVWERQVPSERRLREDQCVPATVACSAERWVSILSESVVPKVASNCRSCAPNRSASMKSCPVNVMLPRNASNVPDNVPEPANEPLKPWPITPNAGALRRQSSCPPDPPNLPDAVNVFAPNARLMAASVTSLPLTRTLP